MNPEREERPGEKPRPLNLSNSDSTSRHEDDWSEEEIAAAFRLILPRLGSIARVALSLPSGWDKEDLLAQVTLVGMPYFPDADIEMPDGRFYARLDDASRPDLAMLRCVWCEATWVGDAYGEPCWNCGDAS